MRNNIFAQLFLQIIPFVITGIVMFLIWDKGFQESTLKSILILTFGLSVIFITVIFSKIVNFYFRVGLKEAAQVFITIFLFSVSFAFYLNLIKSNQLDFVEVFLITFKTFVLPLLIIFTVFIIGIGAYSLLKKIIFGFLK